MNWQHIIINKYTHLIFEIDASKIGVAVTSSCACHEQNSLYSTWTLYISWSLSWQADHSIGLNRKSAALHLNQHIIDIYKRQVIYVGNPTRVSTQNILLCRKTQQGRESAITRLNSSANTFWVFSTTPNWPTRKQCSGQPKPCQNESA